ncbi:MAG: hypothetical protein H0T47_04840 [Planctomycetaceae bacterium]|nr:hypothetical protein [Planctomycetaceae bacterium]
MLRRMRTLTAGLLVPAALGVSSPFLAGCNSGDQTGGTETASTDGQDDHEAGGHEHGPGHEAHDGEGGGHEHPSVGPHGGQILEFGSADYHAELVHDEQAGTVSVYILDPGATTASPVEGELTVNVRKDGQAKQYQLKANPDAGESGGKSSRYTAEDPALGEDLHAGADARLVAKIGGRSYNATIDAHSHDHGGHGHSHSGDDALVWRKEGVKEGAYTIAVGHHGTELHAGETVEPAVMVTKDGEDVPNAKVFNALLAADGQKVVAAEKPTVYEPKTAEEPAHYAQGGLMVPQGAKQVVLRFRVVLPEGGEKTIDVPVDVK